MAKDNQKRNGRHINKVFVSREKFAFRWKKKRSYFLANSICIDYSACLNVRRYPHQS